MQLVALKTSSSEAATQRTQLERLTVHTYTNVAMLAGSTGCSSTTPELKYWNPPGILEFAAENVLQQLPQNFLETLPSWWDSPAHSTIIGTPFSAKHQLVALSANFRDIPNKSGRCRHRLNYIIRGRRCCCSSEFWYSTTKLHRRLTFLYYFQFSIFLRNFTVFPIYRVSWYWSSAAVVDDKPRNRSSCSSLFQENRWW